jgi:uncharacterized protein YjeT (DUF2065 family)
MEANTIRAFIFLVAGLIVILFPDKIMQLQSFVTKKLKIKHKDSKSSLKIIGTIFIVISVVLYIL